MTVETSASQTHQRDVAQLKEICGVGDDDAQKAYKESGCNVERAIEILTEGKRLAADGRNMQIVSCSGSSSAGRSEVVDLTTEEDEVQRAIALSLERSGGKVHGGISQEDEEISRALEESLATNREMVQRGRIDSWMVFIDPLNPHERTRLGDTPVGLKNVGNTCWFSAVIQSLFHLPIVRKHILSYNMPAVSIISSDTPQCDQTGEQQTSSQILLFMQELRVLFSLLVQSKRKYVNPSKPVEILKSAFTTSSSQFSYQQDVSEFTHKLLEWLQQAFAMQQVEGRQEDGEADGSDREEENPVVRLFYGKCRTEGVNEGNRFTNESSFTSFPVQVRGHHDLHSCLEASLVQREIEPVSNNETTAVKAEQETWFTRLPPILSIELSRFEFNQSEQKAEKIHDRLTFPCTMYMDRYLECNKEDVSARRETVYKLRHKLDVLERQLDRFTSYKSKRVALQDVFDLALGFAQTKRMRAEDCERDDDVMETSPQTSQDINSASSQNAVVVEPCPRHVTDEELRMLHSCLTRWKKEVNEDQQGLREDIEDVMNQINEMYNDPSLTQVCYHLYAVLVHEGEAAGGHYWAYINSLATAKWLKFNDISVSEVTWEEVERESMGDHHMASAYCLIYLDKSQREWINCSDEAYCLSPDMQLVVDKDNQELQDEIKEYDDKQQKSQLVPSFSEDARHLGPHPDVTGNESQPAESTLQGLGFPRVLKEPPEAVTELQSPAVEIQQLVNPTALDNFVSEVFTQQYTAKLSEYKQLSDCFSVANDTRLVHLCCYMISSGASPHLIDLAIYEEVLKHLPLESVPAGSHHAVQNVAYRKLRSLGSDEDRVEIQHWKVHFDKFCRATGYLVVGLEHLEMKCNSAALPYLVKAWDVNSQLVFSESQAGRAAEGVLAEARHYCLKSVNSEALRLFISLSADNVDKAMDLIHNLIIPCLPKLETSSLQSDHAAKENVMETWCALLSGDNLGAGRQQRLQEVLEKMLDVSAIRNEIRDAPIAGDLLSDLFQRYKEIIAKLHYK